MRETSTIARWQFGKKGDFESEACKTNEDLLSTPHTNAGNCGRPANGRMPSGFKHFRDIGSVSSIGFILPSEDSRC